MSSIVNQERDAKIVKMRREQKLTYSEIGLRFGLSRNRVMQICNKQDRVDRMKKYRSENPDMFPFESLSNLCKDFIYEQGFSDITEAKSYIENGGIGDMRKPYFGTATYIEMCTFLNIDHNIMDENVEIIKCLEYLKTKGYYAQKK